MRVGALELGGSHVSAAVVDTATASVERVRRLPLDPDGARDALIATIGLAAAGTQGVERLGVAAPGPFDYERGICTIRGVGKLESLYGVDLRRALAEVVAGLDPAAIEFLNDAEAFLLGEAAAGAARGHRRAVGVTLGTGLGSAFLADGAILTSGAGVPPGGDLHEVPFHGGPVEDVVSGRGILARHPAVSDVSALAEAARAGDGRARAAFADTAGALGEHLAPWLEGFGATCLVVGGSISRAWDLLAAPLERSLAGLESLERVAAAERLDDAALLGAALRAATWRERA